MQVERLIARIRGQLEVGTPDLEARSLANEYSTLCLRLRERLEQCNTLIRAGNDNAALQVAESEPDLLTVCAQLSFSEAERWNNLCRERGLPAGFLFDDQQILAVEGLYGKTIGENHPLYRDYRQAMRQRDEDRALTILRSIVRLNPDDPTARSELNRLSEKFLRDALTRVVTFFQEGQRPEAIELMDRMERFGAQHLSEDSRWENARQLRILYLREKAEEQILQLLQEAALAHQQDQWEKCANAIGRIRNLERDHQVKLQAHTLSELERHEKWAGQLAAEAEAEASARATVENLLQEWQTLQKDPPRGTSLAVIISRHNQWLQRAENVSARLPENLIREVQDHRNLVRRKLSRRFAFFITQGVVALSIITGISLYGYNQYQLRLKARAELIEVQKLADSWETLSAVAKLEQIKSAPRLIPMEQAMVEEMKKLKEQLEEQRAAEIKLQAEATYLADRQKEGIDASNFAEITQRTTAYIEALAKVGSKANENLKSILENPAELLATCTKVSETSRQELSDLRLKLKNALGDGDTAMNIVATNETMAALDALLKKLTVAGEKNLEEPQAELENARKRFLSEKKILTTLNLINGANDLPSYLNALNAISKNGSEKPDLVKNAAFVAFQFEKLSNLPRSCLAPHVAAMWDGIPRSDPQGDFMANNLSAIESKILYDLANEDVFASLRRFNIYLTSGKGTRMVRQVFIIGDLITQRNRINDGIEFIVKGREITRDGEIIENAWSRREFNLDKPNSIKSGEELIETSPLPELEYLRQFARLYDTKNRKLTEPIIRKLDLIRNHSSPYLELRAFEMQELFKLAELRPEVWGTLYSPSALRDSDQLRRITQNAMGPYDFLFKDKWADVQKDLRAFFAKSKSPVSYADEARFWRSTISILRTHKSILAGSVTQQGQPILREKVTNVALFGIDKDGKPSILFRVDEEGSLIRVNEPAPLSPLVRLSGTVTEAAQTAGIPTGLTPPEGGWESILQGRDL
jgi:hypothetical protein